MNLKFQSSAKVWLTAFFYFPPDAIKLWWMLNFGHKLGVAYCEYMHLECRFFVDCFVCKATVSGMILWLF